MLCLRLIGDHTNDHDLKEVVGLPCGQWLGLYTPNAGSSSLIPGLGTKIPYAERYGQKKKKNERKKRSLEACL